LESPNILSTKTMGTSLINRLSFSALMMISIWKAYPLETIYFMIFSMTGFLYILKLPVKSEQSDPNRVLKR
jgi:hypothetical protein